MFELKSRDSNTKDYIAKCTQRLLAYITCLFSPEWFEISHCF